MEENKESRIDHPSYYNTGCPTIQFKCECGKTHRISIECIDVIRNMPTWKGNIVKYLWREGLKQEEGLSNIEKVLEDLNKAKWYLEDKIKQFEIELNT